jgi:hypothetical protein
VNLGRPFILTRAGRHRSARTEDGVERSSYDSEVRRSVVIKVVEVEALPNYRIRLRFEDGVEGVADLSGFVGRGVFRMWSEAGCFERVRIGTRGEVRWSDEVVLCPDALYLEVSGKSVEDVFPNSREISLGA